MQLKPLNQQVVAVEGASRGIGRETVFQFAARAAKRVVSARSKSGLQSLVNEINEMGGARSQVPADLTVFEQVLRSLIKPKSEDAPNHLFEPLPSFKHVERDLGGAKVRANSYSTWLERHLTAKWKILALNRFHLIAL